MRWFIAIFLLCALPASEGVLAQSNSLLRIVALHAVMRPSDSNSNDEQRFTVQCPAGYVPTRYSITAAHDDNDFFQQVSGQLINGSKTPVDRNTSITSAQINGGGYVVSLISVGEAHHNSWDLEIVLPCLSAAALADNTLTIVSNRGSAAANAYSAQISYCPSDFPVALGGFSNADAMWLTDSGSAPAWGTPSNPVLLRELGDGQTGPPGGWQSTVFNRFGVPVLLMAFAICGKSPSLQSFI